MTLLSEGHGAQVYDVVAPVDRLIEMWMHRDYAVTKERRGWTVRHTPLTLVGQPEGLYDAARVLVLPQGTNKARLRFWVPQGPQNQLNPLNAERAPEPEEVALEPGLPLGAEPALVVPTSAKGTPVRPAPPPAPWEPQPQLLKPKANGQSDASEVVREWMRRNPGRTFQD